MKLRDNKGSITIFVLVGLLFMSAFLLLSYGSNVNKSKTAKEMFNMVSDIYSYNDRDENAYMRAYTALRKQNAQEIISSSENSSSLELTKTFYGPIKNYTIYGNSVQNGTPSPDNPVEIQSVGDLVTDTADENYGKYKIEVKVSSGRNLFNAKAIANTNIQVKDNGKNIVMPVATSGNGYTTTGSKLSELCPDLNVGDVAILSFKSNTSTNPMIYLTGVADLWYRNTTRTITQEMLNSTVVLYANRYMDGDTIEKTITDLQIEKGTVVTEYETYVQSQTVNIFLDEPLRKVGDAVDYIDFVNQKIYRNVEVIDNTGTLAIDQSYNGISDNVGTNIEIPELKTFEDYTKIEVLTEIASSKIEATYDGYTFEK